MPIPMKNCAARIASAGGRLWMMSARLRIAVTIIGPRIVAPNIPIHSAPFQPISAAASMIAISDNGRLEAGAPTAPVSGAP